MLPVEVETMLPEVVELAKLMRSPVDRRTPGGHWSVSARVLKTGRTSIVAVVVQAESAGGAVQRTRPSDSPVDTAWLRTHFGLTRAEARVAYLLHQRYTNREVAQSLSISPHTARHHTEKILLKLGITRRSEVPARIAEAGTSF